MHERKEVDSLLLTFNSKAVKRDSSFSVMRSCICSQDLCVTWHHTSPRSNFQQGGTYPPSGILVEGGYFPKKKFQRGGTGGGTKFRNFLGIFLPEFFFLLNKNSFSRASRAKIFFCGLSQRGGTQPLGFVQRGGKDPPSGFFQRGGKSKFLLSEGGQTPFPPPYGDV